MGMKEIKFGVEFIDFPDTPASLRCQGTMSVTWISLAFVGLLEKFVLDESDENKADQKNKMLDRNPTVAVLRIDVWKLIPKK